MKKIGRPNSPEPMKMLQVRVPIRLWDVTKFEVKKFIKNNPK